MAKKKEIKNKSIHIFKKGQKFPLDFIYDEQGLCGGDWWNHKDNDPMTDEVVITRNIHFEIIEYK